LVSDCSTVTVDKGVVRTAVTPYVVVIVTYNSHETLHGIHPLEPVGRFRVIHHSVLVALEHRELVPATGSAGNTLTVEHTIHGSFADADGQRKGYHHTLAGSGTSGFADTLGEQTANCTGLTTLGVETEGLHAKSPGKGRGV
jgi:hypothetical protein